MSAAARKISENVNEGDLIREVSRIVSDITGVQLGEKQYSLVQGRLSKRMRELKITDPVQYARHLNANEAIEIGALISLLTTHHTYFFREFSHFEFMLKQTLPAIVKSHQEKGLDTVRIWSAACSRGQEVYSLAMFLKQHLPQIHPKMKFEIVGSDVDEESVGIAKNGVYTWDELKSVPASYLQGNWMRGTGEIASFVRAKDELKKHCSFRTVNLIELHKNPFGASHGPKFDIIFCRNVFIYFNQAQIKAIAQEFLKLLNPVGHLFVGLSESLNGLDLPIDWVGPSVYVPKSAQNSTNVVPLRPNGMPATPRPATPVAGKPASGTPAQVGARPASAPAPQTETWAPQVLKVLCVDDSPTVLTLLKKILTRERGFEVVGTAGDGLEAAERAKALKPDVITLDIHMPKMNGVQFLEHHYKSINVPVVMVSSVSREDSELAFHALELGASDYIEKPGIHNMKQLEEELPFKLRAAAESKVVKPTKDLALDASFKRPPLIMKTEGKLRVIVASFSARDELVKLISSFRAPQPPTLILIDGAGELFTDWVSKKAPKLSGSRVNPPAGIKDLVANSIHFMELGKGIEFLRREPRIARTGCLVMGPYSPQMVKSLVSLQGMHITVEDRGAQNPDDLVAKADQCVPLTSFVYESDRYFAENPGGGK